MEPSAAGTVIWVVAVAGVLGLILFARPRRHVGAGAAGAVYDMLSEDRRRAIGIILEERAAARDPEDRDGHLPDLALGRTTTQGR